MPIIINLKPSDYLETYFFSFFYQFFKEVRGTGILIGSEFRSMIERKLVETTFLSRIVRQQWPVAYLLFQKSGLKS